MNKSSRLLLLSTSTLHGGDYLSYCLSEVRAHFISVSEVIFIPFARPGGKSFEDYTALVAKKFSEIGIRVKGLHEVRGEDELNSAQGFFTGGGNTFLLLKTLYESGYFDTIKRMVGQGVPYMGSSAGTNLAGLTIGTTNDMPIVYPPCFDAFGFIPFNLNPHYIDPVPGSTHMGETRETRIKEFHFHNTQPVLGLREGSWLRVSGGRVTLAGSLNARMFRKDAVPEELFPGDITFEVIG